MTRHNSPADEEEGTEDEDRVRGAMNSHPISDRRDASFRRFGCRPVAGGAIRPLFPIYVLPGCGAGTDRDAGRARIGTQGGHGSGCGAGRDRDAGRGGIGMRRGVLPPAGR
ncbi:hypothetical protein GCM10010230_23540 [Streptomyces narbonensis]|nr:hypothetical protein GCM10010230_23540 [Streptomyces narbonensis]